MASKFNGVQRFDPDAIKKANAKWIARTPKVVDKKEQLRIAHILETKHCMPPPAVNKRLNVCRG